MKSIDLKLQKMWSELRVWIAPFLFGAFPSLVIFDHNIDQLGLERLVAPLIYSMLFALISICISYVLFRNKERASIFSAVWILLFFSYGYIYLKVSESGLLASLPVSLNIVVMGLYALVLTAIGLLLLKSKRLDHFVNLSAVIGAVLVGMNILSIIPFKVQSSIAGQKIRSYRETQLVIDPSQVSPDTVKPDIYYVVFDRYARNDVLQQHFAFDNGDVTALLEAKNFLVADQSYANYPNTFLSLASSLNMSYLDFLEPTIGGHQKDRDMIFKELIQTNALTTFLKSQGYRYVLAGSSWDGTRQSALADENRNVFADFDEYQLQIYERSLLNTVRGMVESKQTFAGVERLKRLESNLPHQLSGIDQQLDIDQPKFVFFHLLLPHDPNIFTADCTPLTFDQIRSLEETEAYLLELQCANEIMRRMVAHILSANNDRPAVIIFQSDEGPYLPSEYFDSGENLALLPDSPTSYTIHSAILNAIYISDKEDRQQPVDYQELGLHEKSSPVNTFRAVLNYYFGLHLPILEDKTYIYTDSEKPYVFENITNSLNVDQTTQPTDSESEK